MEYPGSQGTSNFLHFGWTLGSQSQNKGCLPLATFVALDELFQLENHAKGGGSQMARETDRRIQRREQSLLHDQKKQTPGGFTGLMKIRQNLDHMCSYVPGMTMT